MRLIRETSPDGKCKYAIVRLDKLRSMEAQDADYTQGMKSHLDALHQNGLLEYGEPGTAEECFVIKLKDRFAARAISAYLVSVDDQLDTIINAIICMRRLGMTEEELAPIKIKEMALVEYRADLYQLHLRACGAETRIPT
jgi:hypothetical protein